jgi:hypothetical protein
MEKEKFESMMIEYIDGTLNEADRKMMDDLIQRNRDASHLLHQTKHVLGIIDRSAAAEPSQTLKNKFEEELQKEIAKQKKGRVIQMNSTFVYRMAAGIALVLTAGALFFWINKGIKQERQLAKLQEEMEQTKTMMMALLGNQSSAGQRIQGVSVANKIEKVDDEIVNALVKAMDQDPNVNVRLAALDALSKFHRQTHVRSALIKSLGTQTDPAVQIALIRLLVEMKETQTIKELERISTDDNVLPAVQDEAHAGILKLS